MSETTSFKSSLSAMDRATLLTIFVAALGYFVDVFDLLLFSVVRVQSLKDIGVDEADILSTGIFLINTQMAGLLIGGFLWGVWGDKMGRVSVLFGSILLYSLANIANGFVHSVESYAVLRFIAGIGLAGELGAGVTLASELLPRAWRGLGTTFIATIGMFGAVTAVLVVGITDWRTAYIIGGVLGLLLLLLRINVRESTLYHKARETMGRGDVRILVKDKQKLKRYICVILVGTPIWGVIGLLITFSPEFAKDFGMEILPKAGNAVLFAYLGLFIGDMISGLLSQYLKSRKKAIASSLAATAFFVTLYMIVPHGSLDVYYFMCFLLGAGAGYWAMFIQMGAEQFGTNIRATAATSIPNMVRGLTIPITAGFHALIPLAGVAGAGSIVMAILILLAAASLWTLRETFADDLDFIEK